MEDGKHVDAAEQPEEEEEEEEEGYHQPHQEETPEVADLQHQGGEEVGEGAGGVGERLASVADNAHCPIVYGALFSFS